jgi:hypothetical protein
VSSHTSRRERRTIQKRVDQKVLHDAELITLVRQRQDQFEGHGELGTCSSKPQIARFPRSIEHNFPEAAPACKRDSSAVMELTPLEESAATKPVK